ncbi:MAG: hypothetical protein Q8L55_13625 [Phycisphaerales bacterium]|nr:hypothetical protein [Phycisphaerales bacterium]
MPASPATPPDPDALLCERCGYAIAGLAETEPCPECGDPAGLSWPSRRPGSIYQRRGNVAGRWFWGNVEAITSPRRLYRCVRIDHGAARLMFTNIMLTAAAIAAMWLGAVRANWFLEAGLIWIGSCALLLLLTYIETRGLRLFARAESRKWRVTKDVAWTVCSHATVGWAVGGILLVVVAIINPAERLLTWEWLNTLLYRQLGGRLVSDYYTQLRTVQTLLPLLAGMLAFETLVYIGIRRCRYANTPASAAQQGAPADAPRASA